LSIYQTEDRNAVEVATTRDFVARLDAAASAALTPSRALLDSSAARAIALDLAATFAQCGALLESVVEKRRQMEADTNTRPDLLRAQWSEYGTTVAATASEIQRTIASSIDELRVELKAEALPSSNDPASVLVARQEIELALQASDSASALEVLLQQAERGGDVAAAAASEWSRLHLRIASSGEDTGFESVVDKAIDATALASPDEGRRRAAEALRATRTPAPGRNAASLIEAQVFGNQVVEAAAELATRGIVIP
jgi:hypothetical protein